jgi:hypothetical protein
MKMNHLGTLLAGVGLIVAGGTIASAQVQSDHRGVTLFTGHVRGDQFVCSAVNVSAKPLRIAFAVLDNDGQPLCATPGTCSSQNPNPTSEVTVLPGTEADQGPLILPSTGEGYCEVAVSGTHDPGDVRVLLDVTRTRTIPGTTIPTFEFYNVEGH